MVRRYPKTLEKMFPKAPRHGRELNSEEVRIEGHMKANALMALLCGLEFMKGKGLKLNEYFEYLGKRTATTWDKSVFFSHAAKKTGAHGFLKTMILMFEGMLCNVNEGLDHKLRMSPGGKEATLKMECFGAAVLNRFAEIEPDIKVEELCPLCTSAIEPIIARLGMEVQSTKVPGETCQWTVTETIKKK